MNKILLITPPAVQTNALYPATPYLKGYLRRQGFDASQWDLSITLLNRLFSSSFLKEIFGSAEKIAEGDRSGFSDNTLRILRMRDRYAAVIDPVMNFLRAGDLTLANRICMPDYIPQARAFEAIGDVEELFGSMGTVDCARYISTMMLHDLSSFIRETLTPHFELSRYAEKIAVSVPSFKILEEELQKPLNIIEREMIFLLRERIVTEMPDFILFTIPFPGNLLSSLRCAEYIKKEFPAIKIIAGGGYPSTELRSMSDKGIFQYFDYIVLDGGEKALCAILEGCPPSNTYTRDGFTVPEGSDHIITHRERGYPDFSGLDHSLYFSLCETTNPMHRLWSDGRWNKMILAHDCYWGNCAFCDTSLDYIRYHDKVTAVEFADWMDEVSRQTGSGGFHFVDEAAPPAFLKELSLELLRRKRQYVWWTNIRFEKSYTADLCRLMAAAGCIAVSGGLEAATDSLLRAMNKGISVETATIVLRNFFYAGIMTHTYLMYGFPRQSLQDTVDSLEIVRQMFRAELIGSAFWHRYAMTVHSPSGKEPEKYGVKRKNLHVNTFANNEVFFAEDRGYNISAAGNSLRTAVAAYMAGNSLEKPVHKWFEGKAPETTIEESLITDHIIKPDFSRLYNPDAKLLWIGDRPEATEDGISLILPSEGRQLQLDIPHRDFILSVIRNAEPDGNFTLSDASRLYEESCSESFTEFYHSKKWDIIRKYGMLQV